MARRNTEAPHRGFRRETDLRRRPGSREQRAAILIATNGESTERNYFLALKAEPWVRAARVAVVFARGAPIDVLRDAERRRDRDDYDQASVVCDVDHYEVGPANDEAIARNVRIVWSNPCFEVWLILHKADCNSYLENARKAGKRLNEHVQGWDKTALDFAQFRHGVDAAVKRAKALGPAPDRNPSTMVWQLIEALRETGS